MLQHSLSLRLYTGTAFDQSIIERDLNNSPGNTRYRHHVVGCSGLGCRISKIFACHFLNCFKCAAALVPTAHKSALRTAFFQLACPGSIAEGYPQHSFISDSLEV